MGGQGRVTGMWRIKWCHKGDEKEYVRQGRKKIGAVVSRKEARKESRNKVNVV